MKRWVIFGAALMMVGCASKLRPVQCPATFAFGDLTATFAQFESDNRECDYTLSDGGYISVYLKEPAK